MTAELFTTEKYETGNSVITIKTELSNYNKDTTPQPTLQKMKKSKD